MVVLGAFVVLAGCGFLLVGALAGVFWWSEGRTALRLRRTPRLSPAELASAERLPRWVVVHGRTGQGAEGRLRSPAFDRPCVWFSTEVVRDLHGDHPRYQAVLRRRSGDGPVRLAAGGASVFLDLEALVSLSPPVVEVRRDEGSLPARAVPVAAGSAQPGLARLDAAGELPDVRRGGLLGADLELTETTVPDELELSVRGRPRRTRDERVVVGGAGLSAFPGTPEQWLARLGEDRATSAWMAVRMPVVGVVVTAVGAGLIALGV